ncbi:MAG: leucine-rich repeat domain-containing protein [Clostridia bacterium]|nr:leucine-rich repeat domain-containing protein [Clostridia bacterium]
MKKICLMLLIVLLLTLCLVACNIFESDEEPLECVEHSWMLSYEIEPTCYQEGEKIYYCTNCPEYKTEYTPIVDHEYTDQWAYTDSYHYKATACCGYDQIEQAPHQWDTGYVEKEPTCTKRGTIIYTCEICFDTKYEDIPLIDHTYEEEWTIEESYHYYATTCGCPNESSDKISHEWKDSEIITPPTCVDKGEKSVTCQECYATKIISIPQTYNHLWDGEGVVTPPTCSEQGYTTHTCTVCGKVKTDSIVYRIPHNFEEIVTQPTCQEQGYTSYVCTGCDENYRDNYTKKIDHVYETTVVDPKCASQGYTLHSCTMCDKSYTDTYVEELGHIFEVGYTLEPTCVREGYTMYVCDRCGYNRSDDRVSVVPHTYEATVTPPTCTWQGYTTYTCSVCGDDYTDDYVEKTEHKDVVTSRDEPTCAGYGEIIYTCEDCGFISHGIVDKLDHIYEETIIQPTCTEQGYTIHLCQRCGDSYNTSKVDVLPHTYVDIICTGCGKNEYSLNLDYELHESGVYYTIIGIGQCTDTDLVLPNAHKGLPVHIIGESAFEGNTSITSVTFLSGEYYQEIRSRAFYGCTSLNQITLNQVREIGNYAFSNCGFTQLNIDGDVQYINSFSFSNCSSLTSVSIGPNAISIGVGVFSSCPSLTQFSVDSANESFFAKGNCLVDCSNGYIVSACKESVISQDERITGISSYAFYGCNTITSVNIPKNITFIGPYAFGECPELSHIYLQSSDNWYATQYETEALNKEGGYHCTGAGVPSWMAIYLTRANVEDYWYQKVE